MHKVLTYVTFLILSRIVILRRCQVWNLLNITIDTANCSFTRCCYSSTGLVTLGASLAINISVSRLARIESLYSLCERRRAVAISLVMSQNALRDRASQQSYVHCERTGVYHPFNFYEIMELLHQGKNATGNVLLFSHAEKRNTSRIEGNRMRYAFVISSRCNDGAITAGNFETEFAITARVVVT